MEQIKSLLDKWLAWEGAREKRRSLMEFSDVGASYLPGYVEAYSVECRAYAAVFELLSTCTRADLDGLAMDEVFARVKFLRDKPGGGLVPDPKLLELLNLALHDARANPKRTP